MPNPFDIADAFDDISGYWYTISSSIITTLVHISVICILWTILPIYMQGNRDPCSPAAVTRWAHIIDEAAGGSFVLTD